MWNGACMPMSWENELKEEGKDKQAQGFTKRSPRSSYDGTFAFVNRCELLNPNQRINADLYCWCNYVNKLLSLSARDKLKVG